MALIKLRNSTTAKTVDESTAQPGGAAVTPRRTHAAPSPVGKRRVGGVAVAAALAVVGGVVAYTASQTNHASPYLVANQTIERGERIESSMLTTVEAAGEPATLIPASEAQSVIGQVATTDLQQGSTITRTSTAANLGVGKGESIVGLALEAGRLPTRHLAAGDRVTVVKIPSKGNTAEQNAPTEMVSGVVEGSGKDEASGKSTVEVRVRAEDSAKVAAWAASDAAAVVLQGAAQ